MGRETAELDRQAEAVRAFNRFYTQQLGLLDEGLLNSEFPLTEVRVLYELAHAPGQTASGLSRDLGVDPGYLSRILKKFDKRGLLCRTPAPNDGRQSLLALTEDGHATFAPLHKASHDQMVGLLQRLLPADRARLVAATRTVRRLLVDRESLTDRYRLRAHRPGDIGWITHRQAVLYHQEYGWDETFEALVARIAAAFVEAHDPTRERCWIAEHDGDILGSVFLVRQSDEVAKLRLLYVEPMARGLGIGRHLVEECIAFARAAGYRTLTLWTNDVLTAARRIYETAGFRLVAEEPHRSFGVDLVGQNWDLDL